MIGRLRRYSVVAVVVIVNDTSNVGVIYAHSIWPRQTQRLSTSSPMASQHASYAHIHVHVLSLIPSFLVHSPPFFPDPPRFAPAFQSARPNRPPPTHRLVAPSLRLLPCILLYDVRPHHAPPLQPRHRFLMHTTPQPPQEGSPASGSRSRTRSKHSRRFRDCCHVLHPWRICIARPFDQGLSIWSRVCRVIPSNFLEFSRATLTCQTPPMLSHYFKFNYIYARRGRGRHTVRQSGTVHKSP